MYTRFITTFLCASAALLSSLHAENTPLYDVTCWHGSLSFDLLYWQTCRTDLDFVEVQTEKQEVISISPEYDGGMRLGVHKRALDNLTISFLYTHFNGGMKSYIEDENFKPTRIPLNPSFSYDFEKLAKSAFQLSLNYFDFLFAFDQRPSCYDLSFEPFFGIRYTSMQQKMHSWYLKNPLTEGITGVDEKICTNATGAFVGCATYIYLHPLVSLNGKISFGAHYSANKIENKEFFVTKLRDTHTILTSEVSLGLTMDLPSFLKYSSRFYIGYEINNWYALSDFLQFIENDKFIKISNNSANLSLNGLYVRLDVNF